MPDRSGPRTLCDQVGASVAPQFRIACQRAAAKRKVTLAGYVRLALSERLAADGVRHKRPAEAVEQPKRIRAGSTSSKVFP